jgi:hypothetical protein
MSKFNRVKAISELPSLFEVHSQLNKLGSTTYLKHRIRIINATGEDAEYRYIVEGEEIKYCEFREMGLALVLVYLQRMLLQESWS